MKQARKKNYVFISVILIMSLVLGSSFTYAQETTGDAIIETMENATEDVINNETSETGNVEVFTTAIAQPFADPMLITVTDLADLQSVIDSVSDDSIITVEATGVLEDTIILKKGVNLEFSEGTITAPANKTAFVVVPEEKTEDVSININRLHLVGNGYVDGNGGGVRIDDKNVSLGMFDCKFENLQAEKGGAVYTNGSVTAVFNSTFFQNGAKFQGGAFYIDDNHLMAIGCTLKGNYTMEESGEYESGGGAIYLDAQGTEHGINITATTICENGMDPSGNITTANGGGIYVNGNNNIRNEVNGGIIEDNAALKCGGGLFVKGILSTNQMSVKRCYTTLGDKSASYGGGGIFLYGGMQDSGEPVSFFGNATQIEYNGKNPQGEITTPNGGGIMVLNEISLRSEYLNNNSALYGGGLYTESYADIYVIFMNNYAEVYGGAIYANDIFNFPATAAYNTAGSAGGGLYMGNRYGEKIVGDADKIFSINTFSQNKVVDPETGILSGYGGAIVFSGVEHNVVIIATENSAENGGAVAIINGSKINIEASVIAQNTVSNNGGGIYIDKDSKVNIDVLGENSQSMIAENQGYEGGGIYVEDYNNLVIGKNTYLQGNSADFYKLWDLTDDTTSDEYSKSQIHKTNVLTETYSTYADEDGNDNNFKNAYNNYDVNYLEMKLEKPEPPVEPEKPKPTPDEGEEETEEPGNNGGNNNGGSDNGDNNGSNNGGDNNSNNGNNNGSETGETDKTVPDSEKEVETDVASPEENVVAEDDKPYTEFDENDTPLGVWQKDPETGEWIFIPFEAVPTTNAPATGDTSEMALYTIGMMASMLVLLFISRKKAINK